MKRDDAGVRISESGLRRLHELLAEQMAAVHKVLTVSQTIQHHLDAEGVSINNKWESQDGELHIMPSGQEAEEECQSLCQEASCTHRTKSASLAEPLLDPLNKTLGNQTFPDAVVMKAQVQKALHKEEYNIEDFYFQTGICQGLARSKTFQLLGLMMIVLNLLWIGISTDLNKATVLVKAPLVVQVFENLFTIFFVCELLIRFMALKRKCAALNDVWFVIDTVLVLLMIWETWIEVLLWRLFGNALNFNPIGTQLLRIFRVVRITAWHGLCGCYTISLR